MQLTKPNQDLRCELKAIGLDIEQAADEVLRVTQDCQDIDVPAVLKLIAKMYERANRVATLADEVATGQITRG